MNYQARIIADPDYLRLLGQTFYNFTYLEWIVIWIVAKLSPDGFESVPKAEPAVAVAKALTNATVISSPRLTPGLRRQLITFDAKFRTAIRTRDDIFNIHPSTTGDGARVSGREYEWPAAVLGAAAKLFEDVAIEGDDLLHDGLAKLPM